MPDRFLSLRVVTVFLLLTLVLSAAASGQSEESGGQPAPSFPSTPIDGSSLGGSSTFTDEASFLAAATCASVTLESFEGLTATNTSDQVTIPATDFTISDVDPPNVGIWNVPAFGGSATDGTQWVGFSYRDDAMTPDIKTFTFSSPITHFGINITDYGDFGGGNLDFANDAGDMFTAAVSGGGDGNIQFFGLINPTGSFTTVDLTNPIAGEFYGIDEVYYCAAAPQTPIIEIPTLGQIGLLVLLLALAGAGIMSMRRRPQAR